MDRDEEQKLRLTGKLKKNSKTWKLTDVDIVDAFEEARRLEDKGERVILDTGVTARGGAK